MRSSSPRIALTILSVRLHTDGVARALPRDAGARKLGMTEMNFPIKENGETQGVWDKTPH